MSNADPYRDLFLRSADAIMIVEGDRFIDCNPAAISMFGASDLSEMLTLHPSDLSPPTQPDGRPSFTKANEMIAIAFERGSNRFEWEHVRLNGDVFSAEVLLTAIQKPDRQVLHSVVRDTSERKRLETELQRAQKMEAIGKLAGGIAHDFNNLLVLMLGGCDLLMSADLDPASREHVRQIRTAGERGAELVRELLAFSRDEEVRREPLELGEVVQQLMQMLHRLVSERISLTLHRERPAMILANRTRIEQVLLNLVSNAQDAMPDGGQLQVYVRTGHHAVVGESAILAVTDTGVGMSVEARARAFEPFFTTKVLGAGTGLGLSTVYSIVEQAGGQVEIVSEPGRGTTVTAWFPITNEHVEDGHLKLEFESDGEGELVLLVEDDSAIRQMLELLLLKSGFTVVTASDGREGIAVAEEHRAEISLILTDVVMPNMGGADMVIELRRRGFDTPVVFSSGYTDSELKKLDALNEPIDLIEKPYNLRTLVTRIQAALQRRP